MDIKDKWALVTGASRGIGREIAIALGKLGCNLVLHSRSVKHTNRLAAELSQNGVRALSMAADFSEADQVDKLLSDIEQAEIPIDIVYNNAAIMMPYHEDVWSIPNEEFQKSFQTNVISQIQICNALIPPMLERGWGRVINLTSGINEQPQLAPYALSKAALKKFVQDFVPILKDSGVMMNSLDPGWLKTDMGGSEAPNDVASVLPGALMPALLSYGVSGKEFKAQDYAGMSLVEAKAKCKTESYARVRAIQDVQKNIVL